MTKPRFETPDITASNIEKIAALFPSAITEALDVENSTPEKPVYKKAVNFDTLHQLLSDDLIAGAEAYEFTWVGKRASIVEANKPIRKTLRPYKEESRDWDTTQNLYIEGDNLEVLKLLQESYLGKVKMIYIDPPYNTGNDFVYRDKFKVTSSEWAEDIGQIDKETGDRLFRNTESNGRFHSDWCSMIYPRLLLARNLLSDDGVIFISIDDNEVAQLRKICDEVFGEENFVANFVVIRSEGGGLAKQAVIGHDYLLCYAKNITSFVPLGKPKDIRGKIIVKNGEEYWIETDWLRKEFGKYGTCPYEEIGKWYGTSKKDEIDAGIKNGIYILIDKNDHHIVGRFRKVSEDTSKFYTVLKHLNKRGIYDLEQLELSQYFEFPKSIALLKEIILGATIKSKDQGDIILDFFSGSATTAHAVMQLNAEDGGKRRFIMVQLPEPCDEQNEAFKAGYKNICEIGKERIRRAGDKIVTSLKLQGTREGATREELQKYGCVKLSGFECLAESDGSNGGNLQIGKKTSQGRNLFTVEPDASGGSINTIEYRGGKRAANNGRISTVSADSQRVGSGIGNSIDDLRENWIPCPYGYKSGNAVVDGNQQNAHCPHENTPTCPLVTCNSKLVPDIGFRVFKVADSNMKDVYYGAGEYKQKDLDRFVSNIKENRTALDLLYGCLLDWGLTLDMPHIEEIIDGFTIHIVRDESENAVLAACFDEGISEKAITAIARKKPLRAVFRDSGFASDPVKINVFEIFKLHAPDTQVKVI